MHTQTGDIIEATPVKLTRAERLAIRQEKMDAKPRKCLKCGEKKLGDQFGKNSSSATGRQSYCNACKNALGKRRRDMNVSARLKHHMATRITTQLGPFAPKNLTKNLTEYLGYPISRLVNHLSAELKERENGKKLRQALIDGYHIDHIRPLSSFKVRLEGGIDWDVFRECWAIDNLMAISAEVNLAKGASYDFTDGDGDGDT